MYDGSNSNIFIELPEGELPLKAELWPLETTLLSGLSMLMKWLCVNQHSYLTAINALIAQTLKRPVCVDPWE